MDALSLDDNLHGNQVIKIGSHAHSTPRSHHKAQQQQQQELDGPATPAFLCKQTAQGHWEPNVSTAQRQALALTGKNLKSMLAQHMLQHHSRVSQLNPSAPTTNHVTLIGGGSGPSAEPPSSSPTQLNQTGCLQSAPLLQFASAASQAQNATSGSAPALQLRKSPAGTESSIGQQPY